MMEARFDPSALTFKMKLFERVALWPAVSALGGARGTCNGHVEPISGGI